MDKQPKIEFDPTMMEGITNYDSERLVEFQRVLGEKKANLTAVKEQKYNGSWQRDGIISAYFNLKRKMDRINNMFKTGQLGHIGDDDEQVYDTLMDLANYSDFMVFYFYEKDENFRNRLNLKYPELVKVLGNGE